MSRRPWATAAAGALLLVGCSSGRGDDGGPAGAPSSDAEATAGHEAVDLRAVDLPSSVTGARFPIYSADGERILFSGIPAGGTRVEVMSVAEDGSDLRCLSCEAAAESDAALLKPIPFPDGRAGRGAGRRADAAATSRPRRARMHPLPRRLPGR